MLVLNRLLSSSATFYILHFTRPFPYSLLLLPTNTDYWIVECRCDSWFQKFMKGKHALGAVHSEFHKFKSENSDYRNNYNKVEMASMAGIFFVFWISQISWWIFKEKRFSCVSLYVVVKGFICRVDDWTELDLLYLWNKSRNSSNAMNSNGLSVQGDCHLHQEKTSHSKKLSPPDITSHVPPPPLLPIYEQLEAKVL